MKLESIALLFIPLLLFNCTGYKTLYKVGSDKRTQIVYADSIRIKVKHINAEKKSGFQNSWGYITTQNEQSISVAGKRFFLTKKKTTRIQRSVIISLAEFSKGKGEMKTFLLTMPILVGIAATIINLLTIYWF